ncbi:hypothetical protein CRUP_027267 [Coryphaenoides rupestris]|nr:hypothetical protein CRUP_027267 [Coryphaenoides rupestris]
MAALEAQANQLGVQATLECEKLAKDRMLILQMLNKEKDRLGVLEHRGGYGVPEGRSPPQITYNAAENCYHHHHPQHHPYHHHHHQRRQGHQLPEYLKLSDVYKMYGAALTAHSSCSSSSATLHCLSLAAAAPALSCESRPDGDGGRRLSCSQLSGATPPPQANGFFHEKNALHASKVWALPSGSQAYDTLSLESSDSMETSVSAGNCACSPESASGQEAQRIEEMEKMLREAQQEKARLVENRAHSNLPHLTSAPSNLPHLT